MCRNKIKTLIATFLAMSCVSIGMSTITASAEYNERYICTSDVGAWVRSNAGTWNERVALVHTGEEIFVENIQNGWAKISYTDDYGKTTYGWSVLYAYNKDSTTPAAIITPSQNNNTSPSYQGSQSYNSIYDYLVYDFGFNKAAACAIIVNMIAESNCDPTASCIDTNGLISYGLCQWNGPRYENLQRFCNERGLIISSIDAQMKFLKYELETSYRMQYNAMLNAENSAYGCYQASYYWASLFEVCASKYWIGRADSAYMYYLNH